MRHEKIIICTILSTAGPFNDEYSIVTDLFEWTRKWVEFNFLCVPDFELVCRMSLLFLGITQHILVLFTDVSRQYRSNSLSKTTK
jgi:hypothetical protein